MHRTQILFEEHDFRRLKAEAARSGRSIGAIVREAVSAHLGKDVALEEFLDALDATHGAWADRDVADGREFVERSRRGLEQRLSD